MEHGMAEEHTRGRQGGEQLDGDVKVHIRLRGEEITREELM